MKVGSLYPVEGSGDINMEAEPEIPSHEGGAWNLQLFRLVIIYIACTLINHLEGTDTDSHILSKPTTVF